MCILELFNVSIFYYDPKKHVFYYVMFDYALLLLFWMKFINKNETIPLFIKFISLSKYKLFVCFSLLNIEGGF